MHYLKLHIGDYIKKTRHLNATQEQALVRLLLLYYDTEQPFKDDPKQLARLISMPKSIAAVTAILEQFFYKGEDGLLHQKRADAEIGKVQTLSETKKKKR